MDDDFNTPEAVAVLQGLARELNSKRDAGDTHKAKLIAGELRALAGVLGVLRLPPEQWFRAGVAVAGGLSDTDIDARIAARLEARKAKNWSESDRIRDELAAAGVILEDKPGGLTTWRRA
jgi:cysteinyl-tRNA synthetase